jgi:hypothetical protein
MLVIITGIINIITIINYPEGGMGRQEQGNEIPNAAHEACPNVENFIIRQFDQRTSKPKLSLFLLNGTWRTTFSILFKAPLRGACFLGGFVWLLPLA